MRRTGPTLDSMGIIAFVVLLQLAQIGGAQEERGIGGVRREAQPAASAAIEGDVKSNWLIAIGINQFADERVTALRFCDRDAGGVHQFFTASGFVQPQQAYLLLTGAAEARNRPTRNNILESIQYAASQAGPDSTLILSVASHGFVDKDGSSYILPEDGKIGLLKDTAVSVARINEILKESKAKRKILIVDACRNAPTSDGRGSGATQSQSFLEAVKAGEGQITLTSCGPNQVSFEMDDTRHGVFTYHLLQGLRGAAAANARGLITISSLQDYLAEAVPAWCRQSRRDVQQPMMWGEMGVSIPLAVKGAEVAMAPERFEPMPVEPGRPAPGQAPADRPPASTGPAVRPVPGQNYTETAFNGLNLEMVWIPSGTYLTGLSPAGWKRIGLGAYARESESVEGFWLGKYEVTQKQWNAVMPENPSSFQGDKFPVDTITLQDAMKFCRELSKGIQGHGEEKYSLPTRTQWEYASKADTSSDYFFGNELDTLMKDYAWYDVNSRGSTHEVGLLKPNPWGLYDILGNVSELCMGNTCMGGHWNASGKVVMHSTYGSPLSAAGATFPIIGFRVARTPKP